MSESPSDNAWGDFLKRITSRDGWSVARLAREAGRHPSTIWDWMNAGTGEKLTIESIIAIATATGEHPLTVFKAAAGLIEEEPEDEAIGIVMQADLTDDQKNRIVDTIMSRKDSDSERRVQDARDMVRLAGGDVNAGRRR